ncbi:carbon catabolite repressor protein, partial [Reticulomyxa filosa]
NKIYQSHTVRTNFCLCTNAKLVSRLSKKKKTKQSPKGKNDSSESKGEKQLAIRLSEKLKRSLEHIDSLMEQKHDEKSFRFRVTTLNILSDEYCSPKQYPYCPTDQLKWEQRLTHLLQFLSACNSELIALQEVDHPTDIIMPYKIVIITIMQKEQDKKLMVFFSVDKNIINIYAYMYICCLLLWSKKHFAMYDTDKKFPTFSNPMTIELNDLADACTSTNVQNHYRRDNVASFVLLQHRPNHVILFCTCHLYYHWLKGDVRLRQCAYIVNILHYVASQIMHTDQNIQNVSILLTGLLCCFFASLNFFFVLIMCNQFEHATYIHIHIYICICIYIYYVIYIYIIILYTYVYKYIFFVKERFCIYLCILYAQKGDFNAIPGSGAFQYLAKGTHTMKAHGNSELKLIMDPSLNKLARWMRAIGVDTTFFDPTNANNEFFDPTTVEKPINTIVDEKNDVLSSMSMPSISTTGKKKKKDDRKENEEREDNNANANGNESANKNNNDDESATSQAYASVIKETTANGNKNESKSGNKKQWSKSQSSLARDCKKLFDVAKQQGRYLITKSKQLAARRDCPPHVFLHSNDMILNLQYLIQYFGISYDQQALFTR